MMAGLDIQGVSGAYYVISDGERLQGPFSDRWRVEDVRDELARKGNEKLRPCLTCSDIFLSEGPHNRMCDPCREGTEDEQEEAK